MYFTYVNDLTNPFSKLNLFTSKTSLHLRRCISTMTTHRPKTSLLTWTSKLSISINPSIYMHEPLFTSSFLQKSRTVSSCKLLMATSNAETGQYLSRRRTPVSLSFSMTTRAFFSTKLYSANWVLNALIIADTSTVLPWLSPAPAQMGRVGYVR